MKNNCIAALTDVLFRSTDSKGGKKWLRINEELTKQWFSVFLFLIFFVCVFYFM